MSGNHRESDMATSRERMLAAMEYRETDYIPCSFMLFFNMSCRSGSEREFAEKQLEMGLDAYTHVGHLRHAMHPHAKYSEWVEKKEGTKYFCRKIDTPAGSLAGRVRQREGWPTEGNFPLFNDWLVARNEEVLVKPEEDLEKLRYFFGPFRDEDINKLRETAAEAKKISDEAGVLKVGGWRSQIVPGGLPLEHRGGSDGGVMGCDAMAWLSGFEEVMVLSLTRPEVLMEYANIIHEWNMKQIEIYLDVADPDIIWRRAWYETTEFWTPGAYRTIIAPTIRKEAELVHQAGKKYGYIITSAFEPLLDDMLDADIDVLIGVDPKDGTGTDLSLVKQKFAKRKKALWGGTSGAITVEMGTKEETEEAVIEALTTLGEGGGFILSPVDNVREDTQRAWENTRVFVNTWKRYRAEKL